MIAKSNFVYNFSFNKFRPNQKSWPNYVISDTGSIFTLESCFVVFPTIHSVAEAAVLNHFLNIGYGLVRDTNSLSINAHRSSIVSILSFESGGVASDDDSLRNLAILTLDQQVLNNR